MLADLFIQCSSFGRNHIDLVVFLFICFLYLRVTQGWECCRQLLLGWGLVACIYSTNITYFKLLSDSLHVLIRGTYSNSIANKASFSFLFEKGIFKVGELLDQEFIFFSLPLSFSPISQIFSNLFVYPYVLALIRRFRFCLQYIFPITAGYLSHFLLFSLFFIVSLIDPSFKLKWRIYLASRFLLQCKEIII